MNFTKSYWEQYLSEIGLPELPILEVHLQSFDLKYIQSLYFNMDSVFSDFLKFCSKKNINQLIKSGFKSADLDLMEQGICPHNASIMLKIPLEYGGDIDPDNMYIVFKNPFQFIISHFLAYQIDMFNNESKCINILPNSLFVPNPAGVVFIPALGTLKKKGGISQGGKSTQIASQIEKDKVKNDFNVLVQRNLVKLAKEKNKGK